MKKFLKRFKQFYIKNYTEPSVKEKGFLYIKRNYLADDKQKHLAGTLVTGPVAWGLLIEALNIPNLIAALLAGFISWGIGYLIEFGQYLMGRDVDLHDAHIMWAGGTIVGLLCALIRQIFIL